MSDNMLAEALARQVAIARQPAGQLRRARRRRSSPRSPQAGVDVTGVTLVDGSGLSRHDRVPAARRWPRVVARPPPTARLGQRGRSCSGLPVAGYDGTLADRGDSDPTTAPGHRPGQDRHAARRARAGRHGRRPPTAGCSPSPSLADGVPGGDAAAEGALDDVAAALAALRLPLRPTGGGAAPGVP